MKKYELSRTAYFDIVWNISPIGIVQNFDIAVDVVRKVKQLNKELILLTAAPRIWQESVMMHLGLSGMFDLVHTAETYDSKKEIFDQLALVRNPQQVLSVGDQYHTDIEPAEQAGFKTLHIKEPDDMMLMLALLANS